MKYKAVDIDILVVIILTIISFTLTFTVSSDVVPVRILTLPLVLVLPGYAVTSALLPGGVPGVAERIAFSLGLSLVIVILGGLMLNWTPYGLHTASWAVFLTGVTLAACVVALVRRQRQGISTAGGSGRGYPGEHPGGHLTFTFRQGLYLSLAVLIVCGAFMMSIIGAEQQPRAGFTQLWILSAGRDANAKHAVRIGMSNMELRDMKYRLTVDMDGKVVKEWSSIALNSNEKWETTLVLPPTLHTGTARVEAMLYRMDAPQMVYRYVVLWLAP